MDHGDVIIRFDKVSFGYGHNKPILIEAGFSVRERAKITLMGQNGAGKSTIFQLIAGALSPEEGAVHTRKDATIAMARQTMPREHRESTVLKFFESAFQKRIYNIEPRIKKILEVVHLDAPITKKISALSGGEQARLLLAHALIQNPDILLLDEPTNNLDQEGIGHLTKFLIEYKKTCLVISHDAQFLNAFTHGVLYLDIFTHKIEQYVGDYLKVVQEIAARIERERRKNIRLERDIQNRKEQAGFFEAKGGHMRDVARKMREAIDELQDQMVEMRQEDKTIRDFFIPTQDFEKVELLDGAVVLRIKSVSVMKGKKPAEKKVDVKLKKRQRILIAGPNGIGKSSLLEKIAAGSPKCIEIAPAVKISYYRQDFSGLNFDATVYKTLADAMTTGSEETLRSTAAQFLLTDEVLKHTVGSLSEGQKGLLSIAKIVLERPGLLILDEPTNHINFRHLPVIAKAIDKFEGVIVLVSHMPEFVEKIKIDEVLDLGKA